MKTMSKSEDLLALLFWGLDLLARPSPHNILQSFESWNYQNRLRPQLRQLERARLLARRGSNSAWTYHLTEQGRAAACGGVDPVQRWRRAWDGKWRLLLFDLPSRNHQLRARLWRWLRVERFGYLQNSVWVSPDAVDETCLPLERLKLTPESFTIIEGTPVAPDSDAKIVTGAWDLAAINRHYQRAIELAAEGRELAGRPQITPVLLRQWLAAERDAWLTAISFDPLLPGTMLPQGYLGRDAWNQRQAAFIALARMRSNECAKSVTIVTDSAHES